jgi:putative ABC transport system permease protein
VREHLRRLFSRLANVFSHGAADRELSREIAAHLTLLEDDLKRRGMTPDQARVAARRALGGVVLLKDRHRDERSLPWLDDTKRDVRYAVRTLVRAPGFAVVAVLTLALGIGANTAIYSIVHALLLKPLPYQDSDRLVQLAVTVPAAQSPTGQPMQDAGTISVSERFELQPRTKTLSHLGFCIPALRTLSGSAEAARLQGALVEPAVLRMLGVQPLMGRIFGAGEEVRDPAAVVLLGAVTWHRYFGSDPHILGRTLTLDSKRHTIVGILPEAFAYPDRQTQFWIPLKLSAASGPAARGRAPMLARLADGVSIQTAAAEVDAILRPVEGGEWRYDLVRARDNLVEPVRRLLLALMGTVGVVLLISCVNVASLSLARTAARQHEIAIRVALGAGRARIIRQLLIESVLLALAGGVVGIGLALAGLQLLQTLATTLDRWDLGLQLAFPRLDEIAIDVPVLAFTVASSLATGIACGIAPAFRHSSSDPIDDLKEGGLPAGCRPARPSRLRSALVMAEVGLATMLLVAGALVVHSYVGLLRADPGYDPQNVVTFQVALPEGYSVARLRGFADQVVARLEALAGVKAASYAYQLPTVADRQTARFRRTPDYPEQSTPFPLPGEDARLVSWRYLEVMGIRVLSGRAFVETDRAGSARVLVINQALARRDFGTEDPVGKIVYVGLDREPWLVIGVVSDVRQFGLDEPAEPQVFIDFRQWQGERRSDEPRYFAVRTFGDPAALRADFRSVVRSVDGRAGLFNVDTLANLLANAVSRPRLYAVLFGLFAAVAIVLAAIGIYGVLTYVVAQRRREIGIRMALGARPSTILSLVLRQTGVLALTGIGLGLAAAAALTRHLDWMLVGVEPLDAATFTAAALVFLLIALLASYVPARRATRVNPVVALRSD